MQQPGRGDRPLRRTCRSGSSPACRCRFATTLPLSGYGRGVVCTSFEGRPTKVEGNPRHPASQGATDPFAEAAVLQLYDPDRSRTVRLQTEVSSWEAFVGALLAQMQAARGRRRRRAAPAHRPRHLADARAADRRDPGQVPAGPLAPLRAGGRRQRAARARGWPTAAPSRPCRTRPRRRDPRPGRRPARRRARPDPQRPRLRRAAHGAAGRDGDVPPLRGRAADDADRRQRRQPAGPGAARGRRPRGGGRRSARRRRRPAGAGAGGRAASPTPSRATCSSTRAARWSWSATASRPRSTRSATGSTRKLAGAGHADRAARPGPGGARRLAGRAAQRHAVGRGPHAGDAGVQPGLRRRRPSWASPTRCGASRSASTSGSTSTRRPC